MSKLARDHRNSDVIKIQIARKQLNLTDEEYLISSLRLEAFEILGVGEISTFGDPRTYGLTVEYFFN